MTLTEKLKTWGVAALIAAISLLSILLWQKSLKLKAAKFQLLMQKTDKEAEKIKAKIEELEGKTNKDILIHRAARDQWAINYNTVLEDKKSYEEKYREILALIASKRNSKPDITTSPTPTP